jgi:hypothetical protein
LIMTHARWRLVDGEWLKEEVDGLIVGNGMRREPGREVCALDETLEREDQAATLAKDLPRG